jgi:hypothetical protein
MVAMALEMAALARRQMGEEPEAQRAAARPQKQASALSSLPALAVRRAV